MNVDIFVAQLKANLLNNLENDRDIIRAKLQDKKIKLPLTSTVIV